MFSPPSTRVMAMLVVIPLSGIACLPQEERAAERTRTEFQVRVMATGTSDTLALDRGGEVSLSTARLALGPLAWFEGDALFASRASPGIVEQALAWSPLSIAAAHAHPGHYTPGEALADTGVVGVVDLLAEPTVLAAEGLTGPYGSLQLPFVAEDEGASVTLSGTAQREGDSVPFTIAVPLAKTIEGVPSAFTMQEGGLVTIAVSLRDLVRRIDLSLLPASAEPIDLLTIEQARNAVERSALSQASYTVRYEPQP